jgi:hypothetical protein
VVVTIVRVRFLGWVIGGSSSGRRATGRWPVARAGAWCRARLLAPGGGTVVVVVVDERDKGKATVKGQT